ncbi:MAG: PSD1 and planctomycete cytochrome C domain-containing protein [Planctomycetota bacterium]|nr:PSD1 and planctomycete cytochrome C domain-containing protein [Planctomycetota bacterium]
MYGLLLGVLLAQAPAAPPAVPAPVESPSADDLKFFETSIRPLLVEQCFKCHSDKKQWANLRLDSREAQLKGGDTGAAIVPGKPEESLLIRAVRHVDEDLKMPPESKLTDRQIADLVKWVERGAVFPQAPATSKQRSRDPNHWAFQPRAKVEEPAVRGAGWVRTTVDRFILKKLEEAEITPAADADRLTILRRVTFDLTGLPPTPAEVERFLADERPEAYAELVDRLLASPAYGERWGRHWLDVARYADSNGLDENVCHGNAWRYRDWVVEAINADMPFDQFLTEQLAGDLLPADSEKEKQTHLIATGFLTLGPKVLAEVDEAKMRMDIVDEQIETVGRVFLGMTFGCARCHDHKFDPIATTEYYSLAGVFKSTRTMDQYTKVAKWHENTLPGDETRAGQAEFDRQLKGKQQQVEEFVAKANETARQALNQEATGEPTQEQLEAKYSDETKVALKKLRDELAAFQKAGPELPSAMGVNEDAVIDVAVHLRGNPLKLGDVVPRQVPVAFRGIEPPKFTPMESGRRELAAWLASPQHPLTPRVIVNRVWRWHFGKGLVRSVDNFGLLGETPSHPELLDWLAERFVADGWSLKSLHRLIVTSSVYRQASTPAGEALQRDPENRLYSRADVRRLEAEEVRDALLASSGHLDRTVGGSLLKVENRAYFFDHTSKDLTDYTSDRRSLYLPVVRNNVYDLFQLLDYPDAAVPSGDRATTTVAPQALLMMNSDFVMQSADRLADQLLAHSSVDAERVRELWLRTYGRAPSEGEVASSLEYLGELDKALAAGNPATPETRRQAWGVLCHTTLAANEFIYLR